MAASMWHQKRGLRPMKAMQPSYCRTGIFSGGMHHPDPKHRPHRGIHSRIAELDTGCAGQWPGQARFRAKPHVRPISVQAVNGLILVFYDPRPKIIDGYAEYIQKISPNEKDFASNPY
ncbi:hypothetical protein [Methylorubrum populi]|uniref:hypothetical protein n=1 Tax=Methylorubrum populi TaxID=223967 RepID=UPI001390687F|nr:hypothetical protein [Methylorubrum populi]